MDNNPNNTKNNYYNNKTHRGWYHGGRDEGFKNPPNYWNSGYGGVCSSVPRYAGAWNPADSYQGYQNDNWGYQLGLWNTRQPSFSGWPRLAQERSFAGGPLSNEEPQSLPAPSPPNSSASGGLQRNTLPQKRTKSYFERLTLTDHSGTGSDSSFSLDRPTSKNSAIEASSSTTTQFFSEEDECPPLPPGSPQERCPSNQPCLSVSESDRSSTVNSSSYLSTPQQPEEEFSSKGMKKLLAEMTEQAGSEAVQKQDWIKEEQEMKDVSSQMKVENGDEGDWDSQRQISSPLIYPELDSDVGGEGPVDEEFAAGTVEAPQLGKDVKEAEVSVVDEDCGSAPTEDAQAPEVKGMEELEEKEVVTPPIHRPTRQSQRRGERESRLHDERKQQEAEQVLAKATQERAKKDKLNARKKKAAQKRLINESNQGLSKKPKNQFGPIVLARAKTLFREPRSMKILHASDSEIRPNHLDELGFVPYQEPEKSNILRLAQMNKQNFRTFKDRVEPTAIMTKLKYPPS